MRPHSTHFYTVISSHDATRYHPPSQRSPLVLQPPCDFSPHHVTKACIENHLQRSCTAASPFITLFHSFADTLTRAYYHLRNSATGIQILKLEFPDLTPSIHGDLIVYDSPASEMELLPMAEVGPLLKVSTSYIRSSEFLSCGSIPRSAVVATWPVIGSKLFFEPGIGHSLVELIGHVCGKEMDAVEQRGAMPSEGLVYDWNESVFVGRDRWGDERMNPGFGSGTINPRPAGTNLFRSEGFLRGMIVMD